MRQIYQRPTTLPMPLSLQEMIAASVPENGFDMTTVSELDESITSGNLSRRRYMWTDEEDEDEE